MDPAQANAGEILADLFRAYRSQPDQLPAHVRGRFGEDGEARAVADYVAGMTDRYALDTHQQLFDPEART